MWNRYLDDIKRFYTILTDLQIIVTVFLTIKIIKITVLFTLLTGQSFQVTAVTGLAVYIHILVTALYTLLIGKPIVVT